MVVSTLSSTQIGGTSGWPPWTGGRHMEVAAKAGLTVYIYNERFVVVLNV